MSFMFGDLAIEMNDGQHPPMWVEVQCVVTKKFISDRTPYKPGTRMMAMRQPDGKFWLMLGGEIRKSDAQLGVHFNLI
jgi:hypothetical protein